MKTKGHVCPSRLRFTVGSLLLLLAAALIVQVLTPGPTIAAAPPFHAYLPVVLAPGPGGTPTNTATPVATASPPASLTATPTPGMTTTPSATPTPTDTATLPPTHTATPTFTLMPTPTNTLTPTITPAPTSLPTATPGGSRPLGAVTVISGPTSCDDQTCYEIEVRCPQLASPARAHLKVGAPEDSPSRGTILFLTGWTGQSYWENWGAGPRRVMEELRESGFRTVQLSWSQNWFQGAWGRLEGQARLACRPATVAYWVYTHLHDQGGQEAFGVWGHSNGASEVAYMLAQYGLADITSAALLVGGPNWARIDLACIQDDPTYEALWYNQVERQITDLAFGFPEDGSGPCARQDTSFRAQMQEASIAFGDWEYVYAETMVGFQFGELDDSHTATNGKYFHDYLLGRGTPLLQMQIIPGAPHSTFDTAQGADAIRDFFVRECIPR
jgi:hypothetical protein